MVRKDIEEVRAFNRVYTAFIGLLNHRYLKSKFSLVEARVMHAALNKKGITPSEIVALLNIDKSYLSRIITSLEKRKIITKTKSASDGRSVKIAVTALGEKEFEKLNEASNKQAEGMLSQFKETDRVRVLESMAEIRKVVEKLGS